MSPSKDTRRMMLRSAWSACLVFLLAFAFAPLRPAPRESEGELTEAEEQLEGKTEARALAREQRRATKRGGPQVVSFDTRAPSRIVAADRIPVRPTWQRPRRTPPPDDDDA